MHRVASSNNISGSARPPRKEKRLSYVLNDADDKKVSKYPFTVSFVYNLCRSSSYIFSL